MENPSQSLVVVNPALPALTIEEVISRRNLMVDFVRAVMVEGSDYGVIPGTERNVNGKTIAPKTLLKPGAEKLNTLFGLAPRFIVVEKVEDWTGVEHNGEAFFYYWYKCQLFRGDTFVAEADGSCNSFEKKYRFREAQRVCPNCGQPAIYKSRNAGEGFYCWNKKGGCGARFEENAASIVSQQAGRVANPDINDIVNTLKKMAQKRALIAATLIAVNASEFFTQDLEDMVIDVSANGGHSSVAEGKTIEIETKIVDTTTGEIKGERTPAREPRRETPRVSHPPLSPVQRNKLLELTRAIHGEINAEMKLEALFMENFKHGMSDASYEEGARLTGQLLAELRNKPVIVEPEIREEEPETDQSTEKGHARADALRMLRAFEAQYTAEYANKLREKQDQQLDAQQIVFGLKGTAIGADEELRHALKIHLFGKQDITAAQRTAMRKWIATDAAKPYIAAFVTQQQQSATPKPIQDATWDDLRSAGDRTTAEVSKQPTLPPIAPLPPKIEIPSITAAAAERAARQAASDETMRTATTFSTNRMTRNQKKMLMDGFMQQTKDDENTALKALDAAFRRRFGVSPYEATAEQADQILNELQTANA